MYLKNNLGEVLSEIMKLIKILVTSSEPECFFQTFKKLKKYRSKEFLID